jgi:hypothetical protein
VWGGEETRGLFIGGLRRFGEGRFFSGELGSGELGQLLDDAR